MSEFPAPVIDFLRALAIDHRSPAFLLAASDGNLIASGGDLARYGLTDLILGAPVDEQASFLFGHLPMKKETSFLPFMKADEMLSTDIYLFRGAEGDWVVLLDAVKREEEEQGLQQRGNERSIQYQKLEKEIKKKEVLLHCIVHDLAGPLMGIRGGFELLSMTEKISDQGRELIEIGLRQSTRQEKLIREILQAFAAEIEQFEAFSANAATAPDALSAAREVIALLTAAAELNQLNLRLDPEVDQTADWKVVGERSRLERIFSNLLENALRHSPSNSQITIGLRAEGDEILVTIDDQGPGVPADVAGDLFQKFSQGKGSGRGKIGLGLYFCRITVEKWGGTIGQENRAEGGSRFWFKLPRPKAVEENAN